MPEIQEAQSPEVTINEAREAPEMGAMKVLGEYLRQPGWMVTLPRLTTVVVFSGSLSFDFVWDDWPQIVNNPILRSWSNLPRAFGSDLWYHVARHQVYYRPLFVVWSILNYALFGLRAWGWHLGAILAHVAALAAVFWLARKLRLEYWTAALAALVYALHPIHIEPVVWVSAASDTMVTMFVALAFGAFLNARNPGQTKRKTWWVASLMLLACALLTKEMAVSFLGLVALYAWLNPAEGRTSFVSRTMWAVMDAIPYGMVTFTYMLVRKRALLHATGQFDPNHGMVDVLRTLPLVISFYLGKLLVPIGLTGLYYTRYVTTAIYSQLLMPLLLLGAVLAGLWYWNRREGNSTVAFAGLWMLVGLAPALYLRNFGNGDFIRDRYACLPSVGFAILVAIGVRHLPSIKGLRSQAVQVAAVVLMCVAYVGASLAQQVYWASDLLVWTRGEQMYPGNPYAEVGLSEEYSERGAHELAIALAEKAVREHPEYEYGPLALAEAYIRAGKFDQGRVWMQRVSPEYVESEIGIAGFAGLYGRMGDFDKALALCSEILEKEPNLYSALYNCGNIHFENGEYAEAARLLSRAVALAPDQAGPKHYLGRALLAEGQTAEAMPYLKEAVTLDPKVWDYHYWLGMSLEKSGNMAAARAEYQQALQLNQDSTEARLRLTALEAK